MNERECFINLATEIKSFNLFRYTYSRIYIVDTIEIICVIF